MILVILSIYPSPHDRVHIVLLFLFFRFYSTYISSTAILLQGPGSRLGSLFLSAILVPDIYEPDAAHAKKIALACVVACDR